MQIPEEKPASGSEAMFSLWEGCVTMQAFYMHKKAGTHLSFYDDFMIILSPTILHNYYI